jgi:hypothetical protein
VKTVRLYDDGSHDDGAAGDGFYGGFYTAVNQANTVQPEPEPGGTQPPGKDEGSYLVKILVEGADFQRESLGSFSVLEGDDDNNNNLPDPYEAENDVDGPNGDPDLDGLTTIEEYQIGTDPNNSDTDGGGENDGSESEDGDNPLDPADDDIEAPEHLMATPDIGQNIINYDVKPEYVTMVLYRATAEEGPWTLHVPELDNSGVYTDTADNGTTYFYRYMGIDAEGNRSAIIGTTPVTPSTDPFAPEAAVLIDDGAPTTPDLNVVLSFVPSSEEIEYFEDITEMKLSNDPTLAGASYQPFAQDVPWVLPPTPAGELATVYAQFKDEMGNESLIVQGIIEVEGGTPQFDTDLYMPLIEGKSQ